MKIYGTTENTEITGRKTRRNRLVSLINFNVRQLSEGIKRLRIGIDV